jgi:Ca2+-binding RTX toxin-like protein
MKHKLLALGLPLIFSFLLLIVWAAALVRPLSAGGPTTDIIMTGFTANGHDTVTVTYQITGTAVSPFDISFNSSVNTTYQAADPLLSSVSITNAADRAIGLHVLTFTLGVDMDLVNDGNETNNDYYLLAVADVANTVPENDAHPRNEDNLAVFSGAYNYPGVTNVFVHGTDLADNIVAGSASLQIIPGPTYTYTTATGLRVRVHDGDDYVFSDFIGSVALLGGDDNDELNGGSKPDLIDGGLGDDTLRGKASPDTLLGGVGNDELVGGPGNDVLNGGTGSDTASFPGFTGVNASLTTGVATGLGTDTLIAIENLLGSEVDDVLTGNNAPNVLDGWGGSDILDGRNGADTLYGRKGDDQLKAGPTCAGDGAIDIVDGAEDNDTAINVLNDPDTVIAVENTTC